MSDQRQVSLDKSVDAVGVGRDSMRLISTNDRFEMDIDELQQAIARDKAEGIRPMCIVAMAGTTNTGSIVMILVSRASSSVAEVPLHQRIDAAIGVGNAEFEKVAADDAGDATFARRIYLDISGIIPSADVARQFVADDSPGKRAKLIDQLLNSPQHVRRMQYAFDTMLMERRPDKHIKADEWQNYLRQSFAQNKPWDLLVFQSSMLVSPIMPSNARM